MTIAKKPKVVNLRDTGGKLPDGAMRIDRKTKWGNPFKIGEHGTRENVIEAFRHYCFRSDTIDRMAWEENLATLRGKDLACWCAPLPCHGDVLLELANK